MARTRQEIVDSLLEKAAADPILGTVSRSLVGKELIYFGATVLHQLEQAGATLSSFADLARADAAQLIAYAYTHEVPCSFTKPAIVRLKATTNKVETFAPFTVMLTVGGTRFYNIDFVTTDREFTLYQGTPKAVTSVANKTLDAFGLDSLQIIRQYQNWKLYKEFSEGRYLSSYLKLGDNAIPESVRVFAQALDGVDQGIVFPYTEYNQGLSDPAAKLYKVRTGWDHSINVFFGDDNWAEQVNQDLYNYEIYFLDATITNFTVTANNVLSLGGRQLTQKPSADGESYAVSSYSMGEENSLNYAHTSILAAQFLSQGLITEEQILNYVTSLDSVNSAKLLTDNGTHSVDVVVKPADPDNVEFGYLEDTLRQNGAIGVNYRVLVATAVDFSVTLTLVGSSSSSQSLVRAKQVIEEYCAYNNITLSSQISSATLNQVLQLAGVRDIVATIVVEHETVMQDTQGAQKLSAPPVVNTLKLYDSAGNLIGFDADGVFRRLDSSSVIGDSTSRYWVSKIGDFFFLSPYAGTDRGTFFVDSQNGHLLATPATTLTAPDGNPVGKGVFFKHADNDMVMFLRSNGQVLAFTNSNSIYRGDTSIFNRRTEMRALTSYPVQMPSGITLDAKFHPILLNGYYYFVGKSNNTLKYYRGRLVDVAIVVNEDLGVTIDTATNANSYFVYDGKFMCLNPSGPPYYISWWDATSRGQYTFEVPNYNSLANITLTIKDGRAYMVSRAASDTKMLIVMGSVQTLNSQGVDILRINSPLESPFKLESVEMSDPIFTYWITVFPTDSQTDVAGVAGLFPMLTNGVSLPALDWWKAEQFVSEGSVDYNTGVVYGVYATDGAYFVFNVAGVLSGDTTYPRYVNH